MSDELYSNEIPVEWKIIRKFPMYEISTMMTIRNRKTGRQIPIESFGGSKRALMIKNINYEPIIAHVNEHFVEAFPSMRHLLK